MRSATQIQRLAVLTIVLFATTSAHAFAQATHGIQLENIDRSVRPGDDFYLFANGAWIKRTTIPPDRSSVGVFGVLSDTAARRMSALIEEVATSNAAPASESRKIADLYNSYMDTVTIDQRGLAPIKSQLDVINAIASKQDLARVLGEGLRNDVDPENAGNFHTDNLFGMWVAPGLQDPEHYHAYLLQGGLELPDRDYYLSTSQDAKDLLGKYQAHVSKMLQLAGFNDSDDRAERVVALETAIARTHRSLAESEDINRANNPWSVADFKSKAPGLDWDTYFSAASLANQQMIDVWQPEAFTGESALVASQSLDAWKDLLAYHLIEHFGSALPKAIADERFAFFGAQMTGASQQRPRWARAIGLVNSELGDAVGKLYAKRYFPPEAKATAQAMVSNIIAAFRRRIDALTWMNPATKAQAKAKLDNLYVGVGYPETWRDYSNYQVSANDLFGNLWRAETYELNFQRSRLGAVVNRHEWAMTPQTVNAVNLPLQIALNFPAAILQPPFFDAKAPAAANYGAIGTVIGHEISHTFDSEGAKIDANGRLRNWWTERDLAHFHAATEALAKQYDAYHPFPDVSVNGHLTLPENVADVAGLSAALDGYHASLKGRSAPVQGGYTGDQQFFIAFAQNWGGVTRPAALRRSVMTGIHAPGMYRALEVRNIDAWYRAFAVKPTDKLYLAPDARVKIW